MDFDRKADRWVWLYEYESRKLTFEKPYSSVPKKMHPIVIGSFFLKESEVFLDLRSFDRAVKAVPFFHEHVGPEALRITRAAVVNRFFDVKELLSSNFDSFFCDRNVTERHPDEGVAEIKSLIEANRVEGEYDWSAISKYRAREPLPEIERFPVHFYEEGIGSLEATLRIRQVIAFQHWKGNTDYTFHDVIKAMIPGL